MFDTMISKSLIQWIWVGGSVIVVIVGLIWMLSQPSPGRFLIATLAVALYLGLVRVIAESMIVVFTIDENLRRSRVALEQMLSSQKDLSDRIVGLANRVQPSQATSLSESQVHVAAPATTASYAPARRQAAPAPVSRTPASPVSTATPTVEPKSESSSVDALKKDDYHDRMMAIREQLQREANQKRG